jgi:hypothetical protein
VTTDPCKELIYRGMDYSCCYQECAESNCVVRDCKAITDRASLWFLKNFSCWIPMCEEHEPKPWDLETAVDDEEEGSEPEAN